MAYLCRYKEFSVAARFGTLAVIDFKNVHDAFKGLPCRVRYDDRSDPRRMGVYIDGAEGDRRSFVKGLFSDAFTDTVPSGIFCFVAFVSHEEDPFRIKKMMYTVAFSAARFVCH